MSEIVRLGDDARRRAEVAARLLARDPRVQVVYLFGSAARGEGPGPRDIDLAVLAVPPFTLDELLRHRADVVAVTGAPIDLVSLNGAPIVLVHEVIEGGVCLFARDPEVETELVMRTRLRWWDFKPYRDEQWRLAGQRLAERLGGS